MNALLLHLPKLHAGHRAVMVSIALHGAAIAAAILLCAPGFVTARWSSTKNAAFQSTVVFDHDPGPMTPPPAPTTTVVAEDAGDAPLVEPDLDDPQQPMPTPAPTADHAPMARAAEQMTSMDWTRRVQVVAAMSANEATAPPPEPLPSAGQAAVEPSPVPGHNEPPTYPFVAWRRGIEGTVVVLLEIDAAGVVRRASLAASSGSTLLDDAAVQQLRTWRFEPASPATSEELRLHRRTVVFRLHGD